MNFNEKVYFEYLQKINKMIEDKRLFKESNVIIFKRIQDYTEDKCDKTIELEKKVLIAINI